MHAVVSGWLLGPHSGANQRLLAVLAHAGKHLHEEERITVLHRPEYQPPTLPRTNWLPIDIPTDPTWKRAVREQLRLPTLLKELGATVYDHGFLPPPRVSVPLCLTIHDLRAVDGHTMWPRMVARSVLRKACRRAQAIVTPSECTATRLHAIVPSTTTRTVVARNATSVPTHEPQPLPQPQPENGFILHVGHLEARKNLDVIIRALALLPRAEAPEFWLAGHDAGTGARLRKLAEGLNIEDLVHHLGAVDDETLHALYHHTRAVVMPSIYEGFGMPALEGLAYGKPVLAADATALPEVLAGHGTLLPANQPDAWMRAIRTAIQEPAGPEENPVAAQRRAFVASAATWSDAAASYVATWRDLSVHHKS
ncbi:MAG: glycosyltransferase involved in cell wall biosynthesis [Planctomycetota bacterium]|jgi:glycosyltransferase involved in cell wall biosynthesis